MRKASSKKRTPLRRAVRPTKQPGDEITAKEVLSQIEKVAAEAGIAPEWVYAMRKTGMMVVAANLDQWSKEDLANWAAAVESTTLESQSQGSNHGTDYSCFDGS